jgi:hypothetical protein
MKKEVVVAVSCFLFVLPVAAQNCRSVLGQQAPDAASLKRVEDQWDEAFLHGNIEYLQCLLAPDYASVSPKGVHDRAWELEHARKNKGSTAPIPNVPGMTFEVHGSTAIARLLKPASADGKQPASYAADVFAFQDGAWRALYSQHTAVESK